MSEAQGQDIVQLQQLQHCAVVVRTISLTEPHVSTKGTDNYIAAADPTWTQKEAVSISVRDSSLCLPRIFVCIFCALMRH